MCARCQSATQRIRHTCAKRLRLRAGGCPPSPLPARRATLPLRGLGAGVHLPRPAVTARWRADPHARAACCVRRASCCTEPIVKSKREMGASRLPSCSPLFILGVLVVS